jgi:hypothetical protein
MREEFEARVGVLEREVEGEKLVTRHILEQTRRNGDDLAAVKTRLGRVEGRLDGVEGRLDRVEGKVDGVAQNVHSLTHDLQSLKATVDGLVRNLPKIIGDAVRSALPLRSEKS